MENEKEQEIREWTTTQTDEQLEREREFCVQQLKICPPDDNEFIGQCALTMRIIAETLQERETLRKVREYQNKKEMAELVASAIVKELKAAAPAAEPQQGSSGGAVGDNLHPMSQQDKDMFKRYCNKIYVKNGGFDNDEADIYEILCKPRGKRAAAREIHGIYQNVVNKGFKPNKHHSKGLTWKDWRDMWGRAYGIKFPKYESTTL